jgi:hypothetical protein
MTVPRLDPAERARGVVAASTARARRAGVKADLKLGRLSLAEFLDRANSDPVLARITVLDLITSLPRIGPIRAAALMIDVGIAANRRVGGLGVGQRAALLRAVG